MAHVIEVESMQGMTAQDRCDRCGAQAYVEVALAEDMGTLLFCAHHADQHLPALMATDAMIADHRPSLRKQESAKQQYQAPTP